MKPLSTLINKIEQSLTQNKKNCTFIGYSVNDFGYRFYDDEKHKSLGAEMSIQWKGFV